MVAPGGSFDLFDTGVVRPDLSGGGAGDDAGFNLFPSPPQRESLFVSGRPAASTRTFSSSFAAAASTGELVRSSIRSCSLIFFTSCSLPVAASALRPFPGGGLAHGPEAAFVDAEHSRAELVQLGQGQDAGFVQRGTDHPPGRGEHRGGLGHHPS